jgi:hypothetical protein
LDDKYLETYTPTEEELKDGKDFDTFLYEVAIGKVNYNALAKPTDSSENPPSDNNDQPTKFDS